MGHRLKARLAEEYDGMPLGAGWRNRVCHPVWPAL